MATDIDWLKSLVQLMNQNDLAELSLEEEGRKVRLRKHDAAERPSGHAPSAAPAKAASSAPKGGLGSPSSAAAPAATPATERGPDVVEIVSPMVGTFYRSPSPEADMFVDVGSAVKEETTLCIIEAMKVMNEIKAETDGVVQEVLVSNGEAVEYGQPLFLIKRAK